MFPDVYELYSIIKCKDSTALPRLLQTIESKLILDHVAKRISKERPLMPIFTIHDSVACPVGHEAYVEEVIREEMEKAIGVIPTLKFEYWKTL
jgi:ubiquinone biosynthesis protein Coq4